jgi:glycosyltransferase involved in cell wall biosynthesis
MLRGTPVVASDLPGVRQPVLTTGMGKITPVGDAPAIAEAVLEIVDHPEQFERDRQALARAYDPAHTAEAYEQLIRSLAGRLGRQVAE